MEGRGAKFDLMNWGYGKCSLSTWLLNVGTRKETSGPLKHGYSPGIIMITLSEVGRPAPLWVELFP